MDSPNAPGNQPDNRFQSSHTLPPRLITRGSDKRRPIAIRHGLRRRIFTDLFHVMLSASWLYLLVVISGVLFAANMLFASLYALDPGGIGNSRLGSFFDSFFFSIQTMATLGYGQMYPVDLYSNLLASFEAFFGLICFAMASALLFTKLARPTAKVLFSDVAVFTVRNGRRALMFRLANARRNQIIEGELSVTLLSQEKTLEGESIRQFTDLKLVRDHTPVLAWTWTVVHIIDESSPLANLSFEHMRAKGVEIVVSFVGVDETYSQTVYARHSYVTEELRWNERFSDIVLRDEAGRVLIDYGKFHHTFALAETHHAELVAPAGVGSTPTN